MLAIPQVGPGRSWTWPVPGSKSITNRALLLAALAEGTTVLDNVLESDDTRRMREGLAALGILIRDGAPGQLLVEGGRSRLRPPAGPLAVGNSGTTVRFLAALAPLVGSPVVLQGDDDMARRPIADLAEGLRQLKVTVDCPSGCPPLTISGAPVPGQVRMRGDRSSQYFSALLLCAGLYGGDLELRIEGELVSRPYVEMTCRMVRDFGGRIDPLPDGFLVRRVDGYRARSYRIEPDASAASYPFALAAAAGHRLAVEGLGGGSLQGDYAFCGLLERMGAVVERSPQRTVVAGRGRLRGIEADLHHLSDTVMTLAAIAPLCDGPTTIRNVANIRLKETDRLAATVAELRRLGQGVEHGDDWLRVLPRPLAPATVECYRDHRMAMAFAVLGLAAGGVAIADPACVAKTYPRFFDHLAAFAALPA